MVLGTNGDGYWQALIKTFSVKTAPTKGALCHARKRISFEFFRDIFFKLLSDTHRSAATWHGLRVIAVDGFELLLPRTKDIKKHGYRGRAVSHYLDTHMLHMYLCHAFDVLTGISVDLRYSPWLDELSHAKNMVKHFGKNSLAIYDRLYISTNMLLAHKLAGNFFLMRCRRESFKEIEAYYQSKKQKPKMVTIRGVKLKLFKAVNPKTGKRDVFATNLLWTWLNAQTVQRLYRLRWDVETSFRDITQSLKVEQWHSKSLNGILQELFAAFWLMNFAKTQMNRFWKQKTKNTLSDQYEKPNFKLILSWIREKIHKLLSGITGILKELRTLTKISIEKRVHYARSYPRQLRRPQTGYRYNNLVWVWDH